MLRPMEDIGPEARLRGRCGQLYAVISEALQRLVLDDVNGAGDVLVRALRLTDEDLDDLAFKARLRADAHRAADRGPNAILGPGSPITRKGVKPSKRRKVFERDGYKCRSCERTGDESNPLTIDHVVPLSHGGTNEQRNLQTLCLSCNLRKNELEALPNDPIDLERFDIRLVPRRNRKPC
jgi:5-methylcytosine-specific restriction enzyme A